MATTETREDYLHRLLAELVDAVVGAGYHDLHDYGYDEKEIEEVKELCRAYWSKRRALATTQEKGDQWPNQP